MFWVTLGLCKICIYLFILDEHWELSHVAFCEANLATMKSKQTNECMLLIHANLVTCKCHFFAFKHPWAKRLFEINSYQTCTHRQTQIIKTIEKTQQESVSQYFFTHNLPAVDSRCLQGDMKPKSPQLSYLSQYGGLISTPARDCEPEEEVQGLSLPGRGA